MKMSELFRKTDDAMDRLEAAREAHQAAVAAHTATAAKAKDKLVKEIAAANTERDRCVADAQASYDATVKDTERAREQAAGEMSAAQAELDVLTGQVGTLLGLEKSSRATVISS